MIFLRSSAWVFVCEWPSVSSHECDSCGSPVSVCVHACVRVCVSSRRLYRNGISSTATKVHQTSPHTALDRTSCQPGDGEERRGGHRASLRPNLSVARSHVWYWLVCQVSSLIHLFTFGINTCCNPLTLLDFFLLFFSLTRSARRCVAGVGVG